MERWSSNTGFLLAAIGSAVGIGNIWRFSSVLGQNGGGAYLIPYLIAVFLFALPLMVLELMIGRKFRGTLVSAFRSVRPRFHILGWFLCGIVLLVLSYYLVITGWTIGYAVYALGGSAVSFEQFTGSYLPVLFFFHCNSDNRLDRVTGDPGGDRENINTPHPPVHRHPRCYGDPRGLPARFF